MFRSLSCFAKKFIPKMKYPTLLGFTLASSIYLMDKYSPSFCLSTSPHQLHKPSQIPIKIKDKIKPQQTKIIAYHLSNNLFFLISPNPSTAEDEILPNNHVNIGEEQIKISKVIGKFDNFTIVELQQSPKSQIINLALKQQPELFDEIIILDQSQSYPKIQTSHITGIKLFSKIIDIQCKKGSLVLFNNQPVGIVSSSVQKPQGFSSFVPFGVLQNVIQRIDKNAFNAHLGISVKNADQIKGSFIVRIATSSPFASHAKLGDVITRINDVQVESPQNIKDLINLDAEKTAITVLRNGKEINFNINTL